MSLRKLTAKEKAHAKRLGISCKQYLKNKKELEDYYSHSYISSFRKKGYKNRPYDGVEYTGSNFGEFYALKSNGTWYQVFKSSSGAVVPMFRTLSEAEAKRYFNDHKESIGIQRFHGDMTAGLVDVFPKTVKHNGKTYRKAYQGPHTKDDADGLAKSLRDEGIDVVVREVDRGYLLYVEMG